MIKIQNNNLEQIAYEHYEALKNYIEIKSKYKLETIDNWIKDCFGKKWNFKFIILAKPKELEELIKKSKCNNDFKYFITLYDYFIERKNPKLRVNNNPYNAYYLIKKLNINTCPYCNRNTIYNLNYSSKRTSKLDHFYPKSKYPFLAVSFYNLIPSCKICNFIKNDSDKKDYINPYDDRFDMNKSVRFTFKILNSEFYYSLDGFKISCNLNESISNDEKNRIKNNIKDFKLFDLYKNHKDIVLELIQKEVIYNDSYLDELFKSYEGTLFKNREDLQKLVSGGFIEDESINKRPLSKLIKDITTELDL